MAENASGDTGNEDLTSLSWTDRNWLAYFPLNNESVLEYFSRSPFYDRSCLNEQYKMQRLELTDFEKAPKVYSVLATRIVQSMFHLENAFSVVQEKLPLEQGDWYAWIPRVTQTAEDTATGANGFGSEISERQTVDRLLYGILERNRRVMKETVRSEDDNNHREMST